MPPSSGSRSPTLFGLLDPEDEGIAMFGNVGKYLLFENA
jgi:hypothetical protein